MRDIGVIEAVNVGEIREASYRGRTIKTAIWKFPVAGTHAIRGVTLGKDVQADPRYHGGTHKAVYAYAGEDTDWWQDELDRELEPGMFGENLTTRGIDVTGARVGELWRVGTAVLRVVQPRTPCFKLGLRFGDARFPRRFGKAHRPGAYLQIIEEGEVTAGDELRVLERPDHDVTMSLVHRALLGDREVIPQILELEDLLPSLRTTLSAKLSRD
jgi:MOSC domain-containing protein YiiM